MNIISKDVNPKKAASRDKILPKIMKLSGNITDSH